MMAHKPYKGGLVAKCARYYEKSGGLKMVRCDQCEALMINGIFCHETGCVNAHSRYDAESGEWIRQRKCFDCGFTVDQDDPCCSADNQED